MTDTTTTPGPMPEARRFRKKPVVIEAMQLIDDLRNHTAIATWITLNGGDVDVPFAEPCLYILTLEGRMRAGIGDWIIKGVANEFYPCKDAIFRETYEAAGNDAASVPLPAWADLSELDKGAALLFLSKRENEGTEYAIENYPARYFDHPALTALDDRDASEHAISVQDDADALLAGDCERLYDLALDADRKR
jgi:hypothetical protein